MSASSASVQIEWIEPASGGSSITNYHVYEASGPSPLETDFEFVSDTGTERSYSKSQLVQPGELYHFKVLAINDVGPSTLSDAVSRLAATIPSQPQSLQILGQSTTEISFSWEEVSNDGGSPVTDYVILWNSGSGTIFEDKVESTGLLDPLQYVLADPDITGDKNYRIKVKARNAVGLSSASDELLIISAGLPAAPLALTVIKASTNASQITVTWTENAEDGGTPIIGYQVWFN